MTVALRRPAADLSARGVHRDPSADDAIASGGFAQRMVNKVSSVLAGRTTTRRSFLTKTAVIGSALAVSPFDFILKPGTAYGYTCGTCTDGWTAFCCTINSGRNSCPPGSFIAGWWKADNAAYCCGRARYIIDCNASCPTQCSCRCAGGGCDNRKTCCNQFRYGQCNQQIACYGPVVCRVATCTVPWQYDPSCTTASATDNRTRDHGAPCLSTDCGVSAIETKYQALGGSSGLLGSPVGAEEAVGSGRRRRYQGGNIYWTSALGAHVVYGPILGEYDRQGGPTGDYGFPSTDNRTAGGGRADYVTFEQGRIYRMVSGGALLALPNPYYYKHESLRGVHGYLGYPTSQVKGSLDGRSLYVDFETGRIYRRGSTVTEIHGSVFTYHENNGGVGGRYGYPLIDLIPVGDDRGRTQWFEGGLLWYTSTTGPVGLYGPIKDRYLQNGNARGYLRYPTRSIDAVGDGKGTFAVFEKGRIYDSNSTAAFEVHGAVLDTYLSMGGPQGVLQYPVTELFPTGRGGGKTQWFQGGLMWYTAGTGARALWGDILQRYLTNGHVTGYLRYPTSSVRDVGDGRGTYATFQSGAIYASPSTQGFEVHGAVLDYYLANGGPTGSLGYPTSELDPGGTAGGRFQSFEGGRLTYASGTVSPA